MRTALRDPDAPRSIPPSSHGWSMEKKCCADALAAGGINCGSNTGKASFISFAALFPQSMFDGAVHAAPAALGPDMPLPPYRRWPLGKAGQGTARHGKVPLPDPGGQQPASRCRTERLHQHCITHCSVAPRMLRAGKGGGGTGSRDEFLLFLRAVYWNHWDSGSSLGLSNPAQQAKPSPQFCSPQLLRAPLSSTNPVVPRTDPNKRAAGHH